MVRSASAHHHQIYQHHIKRVNITSPIIYIKQDVFTIYNILNMARPICMSSRWFMTHCKAKWNFWAKYQVKLGRGLFRIKPRRTKWDFENGKDRMAAAGQSDEDMAGGKRKCFWRKMNEGMSNTQEKHDKLWSGQRTGICGGCLYQFSVTETLKQSTESISIGSFELRTLHIHMFCVYGWICVHLYACFGVCVRACVQALESAWWLAMCLYRDVFRNGFCVRRRYTRAGLFPPRWCTICVLA